MPDLTVSGAVDALMSSANQAGIRASMGLSNTLAFDNAEDLERFGDGSDSNVTISSDVALTRNMFYDTLTSAVGGRLFVNSFFVFARTWEASAAPTDAICARDPATGFGGNGGSTGTAGATGGGFTSGQIHGGAGGGTAGAGGTAAGSGGGSTTGRTIYRTTTMLNGRGGAGGAGSGGAGGTNGAQPTNTSHVLRGLNLWYFRNESGVFASVPGTGGGGGGGDGTAGGGGGGSATGVTGVFLSFKTINRGANTNTGIINCRGRNGGNGGTPAAGNRGGGGGGGGSSGGYLRLIYQTITGNTIVGAIDGTGGNGGAGGNGTGTGIGGTGGQSGAGGTAQIFNLTAKTHTYVEGSPEVPGGAPSGTTGGAGGVATTNLVDL